MVRPHQCCFCRPCAGSLTFPPHHKGEKHSHVGLVKNNLGVLYVLGGHLTAARDLFQSSLAILHKSHAASHPLLISVRANLEQVEAHLVAGTIDVRQLKRYFHGQHFYYSPFGDTKREEKMQKAEEAQAQQEQGDKKKPIPPEWQKLFAQANIDVAALSYEKAQALIAALKKKVTDAPEVLAVIRDPELSRVGDLINSIYNSEYATFFQSLGTCTRDLSTTFCSAGPVCADRMPLLLLGRCVSPQLRSRTESSGIATWPSTCDTTAER